jgi:hypothetical protein
MRELLLILTFRIFRYIFIFPAIIVAAISRAWEVNRTRYK